MKITQLYTKCLAQGAYYISHNGEAAIIDPLRETQPYIDLLTQDNAKLKYIFETHFHADFVSGHIDLSQKTGAAIVYGETANPSFETIIAKDNQIFEIGAIKIKAIHTPGHTLESTCYLLIDENGKEQALFSGDTLFLGDVGRPDLAQKATNMSQEELAGLLYDSLYNKIITLPNDIIVYPAHGAGSACGKNMMKETSDTLGNQKNMNYALNQINKDEFVKAVLDGLLPPPGYFGMNVAMNKDGYKNFDTVLKNSLIGLSANDFNTKSKEDNTLILDVRDSTEFTKGFIPNAVNIGLKGDFAPWVGSIVIDVKKPILLVCNIGDEIETITRLSRVGFDNVIGYLDGGFDTWIKAGFKIDSINRISAQQFEEEIKNKNFKIIDVRKCNEYNTSHIVNAINKPLNDIQSWAKDLDANEPIYIHCQGGYRSMIASSILKTYGIDKFKEIEGGYNAISKSNIACISE